MEVSGQLHAPASVSPGISPRYPLHKRLRGPQSRTLWRKDESFPLPGIEPRLISRPLHKLVAMMTELYGLLTFNSRTINE
jgi:hypothetical protein